MNSHRIKTAITENGKLSLQNLPFKKGDEVEIIIRQQNTEEINFEDSSLQGTVLRYEDPFDPVTSPEEWNANN
ncbi:MAG: hypothetical protein AAGE96_12555 [Cyanobacteria bacterium P01_G01_bin.19]